MKNNIFLVFTFTFFIALTSRANSIQSICTEVKGQIDTNYVTGEASCTLYNGNQDQFNSLSDGCDSLGYMISSIRKGVKCAPDRNQYSSTQPSKDEADPTSEISLGPATDNVTIANDTGKTGPPHGSSLCKGEKDVQCEQSVKEAKVCVHKDESQQLSCLSQAHRHCQGDTYCQDAVMEVGGGLIEKHRYNVTNAISQASNLIASEAPDLCKDSLKKTNTCCQEPLSCFFDDPETGKTVSRSAKAGGMFLSAFQGVKGDLVKACETMKNMHLQELSNSNQKTLLQKNYVENERNREAIRNINTVHKNTILQTRDSYDHRVKNLLNETNLEKKEMHDRYTANLEKIFDDVNLEKKELAQSLRKQHEKTLDEVKNKAMEKEINLVAKHDREVAELKSNINRLKKDLTLQKRDMTQKNQMAIKKLIEADEDKLGAVTKQYDEKLEQTKVGHRKEVDTLNRRHQLEINNLISATKKA
ncbi:hypothetical protein N9W41_01405 [bacterium]|nr:hypothetical protein [bacterium]